MKMKRLVATLSAVAISGLVLSACSAPNREPEIVGGSSVTASWNDPFYSYNNSTSANNAAANANIIALANDGFFHYDPTPSYVEDTGFGKIEKISDDPLTVKYTVNGDVKWSDGTPMDGADLLMLWASHTTARTGDIPQPEYDDDGNVTNQDAIDAASKTAPNWGVYPVADQQLDLVKDVPKIDGNSMTLTYSQPFVDWKYFGADTDLNISAHGTMQLAFPGQYDGKAEDAKKAFIKAVEDNDTATLVKVADVYRTGYDMSDYDSSTGAPQQVLSNGPYVITNLVKDQYVTLKAREDYSWGPKPHYESITVKFIPDPQAQVQAIINGDVQIAAGQPTVDLIQQIQGAAGVESQAGLQGTYEHIDLQATNGGVFDPATYGGDAEKAKKVRQAFLLTVPRQEIVDKLVKPLNPDLDVRNSNVFVPGSDNYKSAVTSNGSDFYNAADADANIEKAKQLLSEAGVSNPQVRLLTAQTNTRRQQELQLITASAQKAGFTVIDASAANWSTVLSTQASAYDAALFGWQSTGLNVGESCPNYIAGGINNYFGWQNDTIEQNCNALSTAIDPAQQLELLTGVEKAVFDEGWSLPIFQFPGVTAWSTKVEGVTAGFLAPDYFWNAADWKPAAQ